MFFPSSYFRLISARAALVLFFGIVLLLCCGRAPAVEASFQSFGDGGTVNNPAFSGAGGAAFSPPALPQALGVGGSGSRDREALATRTRGTQEEASPTGTALEGSFLGALLFGYPYKGLTVLDLLVMALLVFFVFRAVSARRRNQQESDRFSVDRQDFGQNQDSERREGPSQTRARPKTRVEDLRPPDPGTPQGGAQNGAGKSSRDNPWSRRLGGGGSLGQQRPQGRPTNVQENAAAMWGRLSSQEPEQNESPPALVAAGADIPSGFDVHDFLEGARALYVRLQQAWASRKVDDLAPFISAQMLVLLQKQAAASPDPVSVEILLVNAVLNKVTREDTMEKAEVAFSVVMRTAQEEEPEEVDETWLFARGGEFGDMWRLTGIRQA